MMLAAIVDQFDSTPSDLKKADRLLREKDDLKREREAWRKKHAAELKRIEDDIAAPYRNRRKANFKKLNP